MSSINCCSATLCSIVVIVAIVWILLHCSMDPKPYMNDVVDETVSVPAPRLSTKAWFFDPDRQTVIEFDPSVKSLTSLQQQPNPYVDQQIGESSENDDFGAIIYKSGSGYNISIFDKKNKQEVALGNVSSDYNHIALAISGEDVVLLSAPEDECQSVNVFSPRENRIIVGGLAMKQCRSQSLCMASGGTGDVYIFGGFIFGESEMILSSEKFSSESMTMEAIADMPEDIISSFTPYCKTSEYHGKVMLCDNHDFIARSCFMYNPEGDSWETVGGFITDRRNYELVVVGSDLFAVWGNGENSIEKYNEQNKTWEIFMTDADLTIYPVFSAFGI